MKDDKKPICLFDLDGTLINYDECLRRDLEKLRSPNEPSTISWKRKQEPPYILNRMNLIRSSSTWWENLDQLPSGFAILDNAINLGFRIVICTQGPKTNAEAWKGKMIWCLKHLPQDTEITITRDKGLIYGRVLVDDYPEYIMKWLEHRKRGLVIMPAYDYNADFSHPQVIRYKGSVLELANITKALTKARDRKE